MIQQQIAGQQQIFQTTTGEEQAAAAERLSALAGEQVRIAAEQFGCAVDEIGDVSIRSYKKAIVFSKDGKVTADEFEHRLNENMT